MARLVAGLAIICVAFVTSGCSMCCSPYDCHYLYQGGAWVRHNPESGRVGSVYDEAGAPVGLGVAAVAPQPTPAVPESETRPSLEPRVTGETYLPVE